MNALSNLLNERDGVAKGPAAEVVTRIATGADVVPALRLILGVPGQPADESQVMDFLRFTTRRTGVLSDIWVVLERAHLVWAVLPMLSPGRTMLLFTAPTELAGPSAGVIESTIEAVCHHFAGRGVQLAQLLLDPADDVTIATYEHCGFRRMAELIYLQHNVRRAAAPTALPKEIQVLNYSAQTHAAFAAAIVASYEKSLDCPPLNGLRDVADIIAGHQAAGEFNPAEWFVVLHKNLPVAVLLLNQTLAADGMELVYLGLAPAVRGRGLAEYLMLLAESRVRYRKLSRLTLAVDAGNEPALKLYYRHGMQRVTSKVALMRELGKCGVPGAE